MVQFAARFTARIVDRRAARRTARHLTLAVVLLAVGLACPVAAGAADEPLFSGPQAGEKLARFTVRGVFDQDAGKDLDFVGRADGKPIVLIFVHDVNRQSIGMIRVLSSYTVSRAKDGLATGVVWLDDDATAAENTLKRVRHALTPAAPTGVSTEGREGPGSYGLNRNVMLTILVGNEGKVTANFALVQPSLQTDLPKILEQIVKVAGGKVPKLEEIEGMPVVMRRSAAKEPPPDMRALLTPVIRLNATPEEVDQAALKVAAAAAEQEAVRREVGRIATTIVNSDKLDSYGTERAREYLKKWAKTYGTSSAEPQPIAQRGDYAPTMKQVAAKFKGRPGVVLHVGDSITYANPYGQWPRNGEGRTDDDRKVLSWMHAGADDDTDGWWLARDDHPDGGRSHTACSGIRVDELLAGGKQGLPSLREMLDRYQPQLVVLLIGSNDVSSERSREDFIADLAKAVELAAERGVVCIVSTIPPHIGRPRLAAAYNVAIRELAQRHSLPMIDFEQEIVSRRPDDWNGTLLNRDDLHPTATVGEITAASAPTPENLKTSGYLLRGWLSLRKIGEVKRRVIDEL